MKPYAIANSDYMNRKEMQLAGKRICKVLFAALIRFAIFANWAMGFKPVERCVNFVNRIGDATFGRYIKWLLK